MELAYTGQEADFLVRTETFDALILDVGLPDGEGTRWLSAWRFVTLRGQGYRLLAEAPDAG